MSNVHPFPAPPEDDGEDYITRDVAWDEHAEQLVLGSSMGNALAYAEAMDAGLDRTDFHRLGHQLIWDVIGQLVSEGAPTHFVAVRDKVEKLGRLREVAGGMLINDISNLNVPPGAVGHFAEIVRDKAATRRADDLGIRIRAAAHVGAGPDDVGAIIARYQEHEAARTAQASGGGPAHILAAALDWSALFAADYTNVQLLPGRLLAPGQQIAVVGDGKAGKSLFMQEWVWRVATGQSALGDTPQPVVRVLYIDAENGHPELQQRLRSFGAGPQTMGALTYLSFPPIRPLDTAAGGQDLLATAKAVGAEVVVIDTVSRFISGEENTADTWLALYRHTLMPLKAAGIASIRLDHFGKDNERGARGSSAKVQDVDHVWELRAQGGGILSLKRTHSRTGIGPDEFTLIRHSRKIGDDWVAGATRHEPMTFADRAALIEGTTEWLVDQLDTAGVDPTWGNPKVREWCGANGIRVRKDRIEEAVRVRKAKATKATNKVPPHLPRDLETPSATDLPPAPGNPQTKPQVNHSPGTSGEPGGTVPTAPSFPRPLPKEGEGGAHRGTQEPLCTNCGHPLPAYRATAGYDTHLLCDTTICPNTEDT
ncbi:AAA family ATPase [Kitasatospora sp. NPDC002543]